MATEKTFEKEVKKFTSKWDKKQRAFFKKYYSDLAKKKFATPSEINAFWKKNGKPKMEIMFKKMDVEYAKIYSQFH